MQKSYSWPLSPVTRVPADKSSQYLWTSAGQLTQRWQPILIKSGNHKYMKRMLFIQLTHYLILDRNPMADSSREGGNSLQLKEYLGPYICSWSYWSRSRISTRRISSWPSMGGKDLHTLVLNLAHVGQLGRFLSLVEEFCGFQAVVGKYEENALHSV